MQKPLLNISDIECIHVEASSYCNARCPQCPRNFCGWNEPVNIDQVHISVDILAKIVQQIPHPVNANLNGNHGDPMMNPRIVDITKLFAYSAITTNGSVGKLDTYRELAELGVHITFSIDGLHDTNHIYRQDVIWDNLMQRVKTFISAGGIARWKFIPFKHNIHQISLCEQLSIELGFEEFDVDNQNRNYGPILDNTGKQIGFLLPHDRPADPEDYDIDLELELLKNPINLQNNTSDAIIDCEAKKQNTFYVSAHGEVLPCCYHGVNQHIHAQGTTLEQQLQSFNWLESTWGKKDCNETCYTACKR